MMSAVGTRARTRTEDVYAAQKRQARVQTEPISMMVAVPLDQHSPMFGQCDS